MKNYYEILNVDIDAPVDVIKKSYRNLVKKYHPDAKNRESSVEKFNLITEAYKILSDEEERIKYNEKLLKIKVADKKKEESPKNIEIKVTYSRSLGILAKRGFFQKSLTRKHRESRDIKYDIEVVIDYYQAQKGGVINIGVPTKYPCPHCGGADTYCRLCEGKGYIIRAQPIKVVIPPSPISGEIFEVDLSRIKQKNLAVIRAHKLRIKIVLSYKKTELKQLTGERVSLSST